MLKKDIIHSPSGQRGNTTLRPSKQRSALVFLLVAAALLFSACPANPPPPDDGYKTDILETQPDIESKNANSRIIDKSEISYILLDMPEGVRISVLIYESYPTSASSVFRFPTIHYQHADTYSNYTVKDAGREKYEEFVDLIWDYYDEHRDGEVYKSANGSIQISKYDKESGTETDYIIVIKDRRDAKQIKETALATVEKTSDFFESDEFRKEIEDALQ